MAKDEKPQRGRHLRRSGEADVVHRCAERLHDVRVELSSGAAADFEERFVGGPSGTIRAVRCQGIERVRNRDEPRPQRNRATLQVSGITSSVEALMMMKKEQRRVMKSLDVANGHPAPL